MAKSGSKTDTVSQPNIALWICLTALALGAALLALPQLAYAESGIRELPESESQVQLSYAPVVREVAPAVVNVYSRREIRGRQSPYAGNPFFERFFGGGRNSRPRAQQSLGSGVIVSADGIIVTNNHVIAGGTEITVALADRREFDAEVILADERTDIAVLRIDPGGDILPTVAFRNSDSLEVGDLVLALGNPFGVGQTVTSGIVSALARTQVGVSDYQFFIQTDAAVNPGNSGGALVTLDGGLVGINTAIFSRSGGSNGIGFAIPANMVRLVVESAIEGTPIVRPWLGLSSQDVTNDIAETMDLATPTGALVSQVYEDGPADKAGLQSGDIIVSLGGFEITDPATLRYRTGIQSPGTDVELEYIRGSRRRTAELGLEAPPEMPERAITTLEGRHPFDGLTVANLSPAFNEENGVDPMKQGVVITGAEWRNGWRLPFRIGDVVLEINGEDIFYVEDLEEATANRQNFWEVLMERHGETYSFTVRG